MLIRQLLKASNGGVAWGKKKPGQRPGFFCSKYYSITGELLDR